MFFNKAPFMSAAVVPETVRPGLYGEWLITRGDLPKSASGDTNRDKYNLLRRKIFPEATLRNMHLIKDDGSMLDIVMEDSPRELERHIPIWKEAAGRILITGLGLGCVVRGLLVNKKITSIDVVEIDETIIGLIGPTITDDRVTIHHGDAHSFEFKKDTKWDYAWHDIWTEQNIGLAEAHTKIICRFADSVDRQGAWALPRVVKQLCKRNGISLL